MMNKILIFALTFLLVFSGFNGLASAKQVLPEARLVENLNSQGTNLDEYKTVKYNFDAIKVNGDEIKLSGQVNNKVFKLEGKLYKDFNSGNIILGDLIDTVKNFDVVFYAIYFTPGSLPLFNSEIRFQENDVAVNLYLVEKNTRNFYFIEDAGKHNIYKKLNDNEFETANVELRMWYSKYLAPIDVYTQENGSSIMGFQYNRYITRDHVYVRQVFGCNVYETTTLAFYNYHPEVVRENGDFTTGIELIYSRTDSLSLPSENYEGNSLEIGRYASYPTKLDTYTDPGSYVTQVMWNGIAYKPGNIKIEVGWSVSYKGFTFSPSYDEAEYYYEINSAYRLLSAPSREAGVVFSTQSQFLENPTVLKFVGHKYIACMKHLNQTNPGSKKFHARWTYYISSFGGPYYQQGQVIVESNYIHE